jgi:hypothetical protein
MGEIHINCPWAVSRGDRLLGIAVSRERAIGLANEDPQRFAPAFLRNRQTGECWLGCGDEWARVGPVTMFPSAT